MSFREPQVPGIGLTGQFTNSEFNALLAIIAGGGVGLALEIPSGTVNGVNTTFTVVNTPVYIEVSGQGMVSQAEDSTNYGYTFSTGTITFVNAPTQTPHSFY